MRRGRFIALSPKSYCAYDADRDKKKMAFKGKFILIGRPQAGRPASSKQRQAKASIRPHSASSSASSERQYWVLKRVQLNRFVNTLLAACRCLLLAACRCLPLLAACKAAPDKPVQLYQHIFKVSVTARASDCV